MRKLIISLKKTLKFSKKEQKKSLYILYKICKIYWFLKFLNIKKGFGFESSSDEIILHSSSCLNYIFWKLCDSFWNCSKFLLFICSLIFLSDNRIICLIKVSAQINEVCCLNYVFMLSELIMIYRNFIYSFKSKSGLGFLSQ